MAIILRRSRVKIAQIQINDIVVDPLIKPTLYGTEGAMLLFMVFAGIVLFFIFSSPR